jgi:GT2 family glycosyltransferase
MIATILLAVHNRDALTANLLSQLRASFHLFTELRFVIVDDGSTDNTKQIISEFFLSVPSKVKLNFISGPGNWYWARSMYEANKYVENDSDFIFWMNNDIDLLSDSVLRATRLSLDNPSSVFVGQFLDPKSLEPCYGGFRRTGLNPLKIERAVSADFPIHVDTFCGNFVLIPRTVHQVTGLIDGGFSHAYADLDYGYRVRKNGFKITLIPGLVGYCETNSYPTNLTRIQMLREWNSVKRSPISSQFRFMRRHAAYSWPIFVIAPYLRILIFGKTRIK